MQDGAVDVIRRTLTRADNLNITQISYTVNTANTVDLWYHNSNRLQNANGPWGAKTYYLDGVGNRTHEITTVGASTTTDVYNYPGASNRLNDVVRNGTATVRAFTYDGAGNILTDNRAGSTTTYTYNNRNRLETAPPAQRPGQAWARWCGGTRTTRVSSWCGATSTSAAST